MQRRMKGLCRMCGERYDASIGSVDIYEDRGPQQPYYILLRDMMNLNPQPGDQKPDRLGLTCAKLLDDWAKFRERCFETQKILKKKAAQMKADKEAALKDQTSNGASSSNQPSTSGVPPNSSALDSSDEQSDSTDSSLVIKIMKRPHSSDSESEEDDKLSNKNPKMTTCLF